MRPFHRRHVQLNWFRGACFFAGFVPDSRLGGQPLGETLRAEKALALVGCDEGIDGVSNGVCTISTPVYDLNFL